METKDHLLLADRLLAGRRDGLPRGFAAGFRMGSVLPDCNPFTYFRGLRGRQGLHGHNAEITGHRICGLLARLKKCDRRGFLYGLRLGTALHYLADAFTYPHHAYYPGSLAEHVAYEVSLHRVFADRLQGGCNPLWQEVRDFPAYLSAMLTLYRQCRKGADTDCRFITQMCGLAYETALRRREKEDVPHEDSDYNRSVSAVR